MALPSFLQAMFTPTGPPRQRMDQGGGEYTGFIPGVYEGDDSSPIDFQRSMTSRSVSGPTTRRIPERLPDPTATTGTGPTPTQEMIKAIGDMIPGDDGGGMNDVSISEVMEASTPIGNMSGGWADDGDPGMVSGPMFTPSEPSSLPSGPMFAPSEPSSLPSRPMFVPSESSALSSSAPQDPMGTIPRHSNAHGFVSGDSPVPARRPQFEATLDDIGGPPMTPPTTRPPRDNPLGPLAAAGGVVGGAGLAASAPWWMKLLGKTFTPIGARAVPGYNLAGWGKYKDIAHLLGRGLKGVSGGAVGKLPTSTIGGALGRLSLPITAAMFFNEMRKNPDMHPGNLDPETTGTGAAVSGENRFGDVGQTNLSNLPSDTEKYMRQAGIPEEEIITILKENYVGPASSFIPE